MLAVWRSLAARARLSNFFCRRKVASRSSKQRQPLGVFQTGGFGLSTKFREALGHAMEAEGVEQIEGGMGEHVIVLQWK